MGLLFANDHSMNCGCKGRREKRMRRQMVSVLMAGFFASPGWGGELAEVLRETRDHPAVAAAAGRVDAAQQQLSATRSRYLGTGGVMAEAARYEDQRFVGVLSPAALAHPPFARDLLSYGVSYTVPIDWAGVIAEARRAGRSNLAAARFAERQTALLKLHEATSAYVHLQALQQQQEVLAVQRERVRQTVERVQVQVETEQASTAQLRLAQAEQARLQSDEVRLSGEVAAEQAALEETTGRRLLPSEMTISIPPWKSDSSTDFLPSALANAQAQAAAAQAHELSRSLWPALAAGAEYVQFDGNDHSPDAWSMSARLTVPIDPSAWKRVAAAQAQARAATQEKQATERQAQRDWTALQSAYQAARADVGALEKEVEARREVVRVQAELQRVGLASLEDFLRQQRDLLEAEARLIQARAGAVISWSAAQVLLGSEPEDYINSLDISTVKK